MSGGWAGSDRRARLPDDWNWRREQVKQRAGGRCEEKIPGRNGGRFRCSATGTDCDHIVRGDNHDLSNLRWVCARHHSAKTAAEGNQAKAAIKATGTRTPERHPSSLRRRST